MRYGGSIDALDAPLDPAASLPDILPHKKLANVLIPFVNEETFQFQARGINPTPITKAGPWISYNTNHTLEAAFYVIFVEYDVCDPTDCVVAFKESGFIRRFTSKTDKSEHFEFSSDPTSDTLTAYGKYKRPIGVCTHMLVYADAPGAVAVLGQSPNGFYEEVDQFVSIRDRLDGFNYAAPDVYWGVAIGVGLDGKLTQWSGGP